jgi:hypothetical protein
MGERIPPGETIVEGDQLSVDANHPAPCPRTAGRRARKRQAVVPLPALDLELARTLGHFFPQFGRWLAGLPDTRCQGKVVYDKTLCLWEAMDIFFLGLGSRRQFDHEARRDAASPDQILRRNLNRLAHTEAQDIAHGDTVNDYLMTLDPERLGTIPRLMAQRLLRMRVLEYARLQDRYLIAIDATGLWTWQHRHCDACLHQTHNGVTTYYHLVLEAKLITPDGLAFSVGSEFIENVDPHATKQDCELAALPRLLAKLKALFPRLPICLLFDSLYANQTVFRLCRQHDWRWIISFKEGSLPIAFGEFHTLKRLSPDHLLETDVNGRYPRLSWIHDLEHEEFRFTAFDCLTYKDDGEVVYFAWITDMPVRRDTVGELANHGGRKRWTIENQGFRNQKHQEYRLEHPYSDDPIALKNYYFIVQIVQAIVQLLVRGLLAGVFRRSIGSIKNLFRRLTDSFHHQLIPAEAVDPSVLATIQIRLDTS